MGNKGNALHAIAGHSEEVVDQTEVATAKTLRVSERTSGTSNVAVRQMSAYVTDGLLDKGGRAG